MNKLTHHYLRMAMPPIPNEEPPKNYSHQAAPIDWAWCVIRWLERRLTAIERWRTERVYQKYVDQFVHWFVWDIVTHRDEWDDVDLIYFRKQRKGADDHPFYANEITITKQSKNILVRPQGVFVGLTDKQMDKIHSAFIMSELLLTSKQENSNGNS